MLSNFELEDMCNELQLPMVSICMKDELPKSVQDGGYIINLDSSTNSNGTHWTAMVIQGNEAQFFDPFGVVPSVEIIHFVKKRPKCKLAYVSTQIQDLKSQRCGYFCVAFLYYCIKLCPGSIFDSGNDFPTLFSDDTIENDSLLRKIFQYMR
jgi:hypothetical protein